MLNFVYLLAGNLSRSFYFLFTDGDSNKMSWEVFEEGFPFWISFYVDLCWVWCVIDCKTLRGNLLILGYANKLNLAGHWCLAEASNQRQSRLEIGSLGCSMVVFSQLPCLSSLLPASSFSAFLPPVIFTAAEGLPGRAAFRHHHAP